MARKKIPKNGNKTLNRRVSGNDIVKFQRTVANHWIWKRAEIIRLASEGYNNREIQDITKINEKNVRYWINRFNNEEFKGLFRRKSKRHRGELTEDQIKELKELLKMRPDELGYDVLAWTSKLVWKLIQDIFEIKYHPRHIYRLIRRIGFKLAKPYVTNKSQDQEEVKKFYKQVLPSALKKNDNLKRRV